MNYCKTSWHLCAKI